MKAVSQAGIQVSSCQKENALHFNGIYVCECIEFMTSKIHPKMGRMGLKKQK